MSEPMPHFCNVAYNAVTKWLPHRIKELEKQNREIKDSNWNGEFTEPPTNKQQRQIDDNEEAIRRIERERRQIADWLAARCSYPADFLR